MLRTLIMPTTKVRPEATRKRSRPVMSKVLCPFFYHNLIKIIPYLKAKLAFLEKYHTPTFNESPDRFLLQR